MIDFITDKQAWNKALSHVKTHDFYHTFDYHRLEKGSGVQPTLVHFSHARATVLLPLMLRATPVQGFLDATSVYGYAGPLSADTQADDILIFQQELQQELSGRNVVSLFSRLHPLIPQGNLISGLGQQPLSGTTVSIDLSPSAEEQLGNYKKGTRYDINKLSRSGFTGTELSWREYRNDFISIYEATMRRVGAGAMYFFSPDYYDGLFDLDGVQTKLFGCLKDDKVVCAAIFTLCDGIVQYHLSGTHESAVAAGPTKLMIDTARRWAVEQQARVLHLGGGVSGTKDSLFKFKAGFSPLEHSFQLWKWIINPDAYHELCSVMGSDQESSYFPAYRAFKPRPS